MKADLRTGKLSSSKFALLSGVAVLYTCSAHAQTVAPGAGQPADPTVLPDSASPAADSAIGDIVVTGFRASVANALAKKRSDSRITDGISAEDIGKFPSENIAEAIQRVSGVQMSNVNGRGATISVRGLGPQYALVTVNGQTFKSADFTDGFRFDVIQTDLASSVQVIKSPTADMDAGGLAGTINIDTIKPLDYHKRQISLSLKGQRSPYAGGGMTPKISGSYVDQFAGDTIGVSLTASYQKLRDRADYFWLDRWNTTDTADGVFYTPRRPRYRRIDRSTRRLLLSGSVQYKPNDEAEFGINAIYAQDHTNYDVNQQVFLFTANGITVDKSTALTATRVTATNFTLENNRQLEKRNLASQDYNAYARFQRNGWLARLNVNYTKGSSYDTEEAAIVGINISSATLDISNPKDVFFSVSNDLDNTAQYDPYQTVRNEYPDGAQNRLTSDEGSLQLDVTKDLNLGLLKSVQLGAKYRHETFDRHVTRRDRDPYGEADPADLPDFSQNYLSVGGFLDGEMSIPHSWVAPDIDAYRKALEDEGFVVPTVFSPSSSYSVDRYMPSAYAMANLNTEIFSIPLRGNIGVRYEHTSQKVHGYLTAPDPDNENVDLATGTFVQSKKYGNWLPSINLTANLTNNLLLRVAAAKVLVRPILDDNTSLATVTSTSSNSFGTKDIDISLAQGELDPLTANQADVSLEWYFDGSNGITIAGFLKDVKNGTYSSLICPATYNGVALSPDAGGDCTDAAGNFYNITQTLNDPSTVRLKGVEVGWTQSLDRWLPVKGFGFTANYTYVDPDYDEDQGYRVRNLSKRTWNVTGYWENSMYSARVSVNHRSKYNQTSADSFFAHDGHVVRARTQVDLAFGYTPIKHLEFTAGIINLNNTKEEAYLEYPDRWQESSFFGRSYYLSAKVKF